MAARAALMFPGLCLADSVSSRAFPTPPPRPPELSAPPLSGGRNSDRVCETDAGVGVMQGDALEPITAEGGCGVADPVLLKSITLRDGLRVLVVPPARIGCPLAVALARWLRDDVAVSIPQESGALAQIEIAGAYECRGRNRDAAAKLSEHGKGNALDITAFLSDKGRRFGISRQATPPAFFQSLKGGACARFMTVLGPGSDSFHETHLHVDLEERKHGAHVCQWLIN